MVLTVRSVLQFFILIFSINGLYSYSVRRNHNPLGVLSELLQRGSKSPLIVVVDTASLHASPQGLDSDDERSHSKSCPHKSHGHSRGNSVSQDAYEAALFDILRQNYQPASQSTLPFGVAEQCSGETVEGCPDGPETDPNKGNC